MKINVIDAKFVKEILENYSENYHVSESEQTAINTVIDIMNRKILTHINSGHVLSLEKQ